MDLENFEIGRYLDLDKPENEEGNFYCEFDVVGEYGVLQHFSIKSSNADDFFNNLCEAVRTKIE